MYSLYIKKFLKFYFHLQYFQVSSFVRIGHSRAFIIRLFAAFEQMSRKDSSSKPVPFYPKRTSSKNYFCYWNQFR